MNKREQAQHILRMYQPHEIEDAITEALEHFEERGKRRTLEALSALVRHQPGCPMNSGGDECLCSEIMEPRL